MLTYTSGEPGLIAFYDIGPGNGAGLLLCPVHNNDKVEFDTFDFVNRR